MSPIIIDVTRVCSKPYTGNSTFVCNSHVYIYVCSTQPLTDAIVNTVFSRDILKGGILACEPVVGVSWGCIIFWKI